MIVLGIETTCDETAVALVQDGKKILSNVVASSADLHAKYGGVFPELSSRRHAEAIVPTLETALSQANISPDQIDLIAVAHGPGLIGSLLVGVHFAKGLALAWDKPWIGVSHIEAHLYAAFMQTSFSPALFPSLGLVLSGGHTLLLKMEGVGRYELLGTTVDDAIGEAFDKVGSLLGLPYPGGPKVEALARGISPQKGLFTAGHVKKNPLDFSFSGLKTSVLYALQKEGSSPSLEKKQQIAAAFQETALQDIVKKALRAAQTFDCQAIFLGGGVCNNLRLQELMQSAFAPKPVHFPSFSLSLDNGAMIAGLGYQKFLQNPQSSPWYLEAIPRIPIA